MSISIASAIAEGAEALRAAHTHDQLMGDQLESFRAFVGRRSRGEPLQYITGHQEFFKLDFEVDRNVLIPRPETELVVEVSLELLRETAAPLIADVGTGSGCIAISLLHELPSARGVAGDISSAALAVAQRNAARHGVTNRLDLVESDCFSRINRGEGFSLIASNPPYVSDVELTTLSREVQAEPQLALAGGPDGLSVIRRLLAQAHEYLHTRGHFVFEIGFGQSEAVRKLIDLQNWELIEMRNDLQGITRTVVLQKSS